LRASRGLANGRWGLGGAPTLAEFGGGPK